MARTISRPGERGVLPEFSKPAEKAACDTGTMRSGMHERKPRIPEPASSQRGKRQPHRRSRQLRRRNGNDQQKDEFVSRHSWAPLIPPQSEDETRRPQAAAALARTSGSLWP